MAPFDPHRPPMSLQESEDLLRGHATHERVKGDWAFLGRSGLLVVALVGIAAGLFFMIAGWFR